MDYPFKNIEHRIYKNTFLQNTLVEMQYESIKSRLSAKEVFCDFQSFASKNLGIDDIKEDEGLTEKGIIISSDEIDTKFYIYDNKLIIKIGRKNYSSFQESVIPYIKIAEDFLQSVAKLEVINSLEIRKINIWPYNILDQNTLTETLMSKIFSKELLENGNFKSQSPENRNVTQWMKEKIFNWEDILLKLKYGFIAKDEQHDKERIILDSTAESSHKATIDNGEMRALLEKLNTILFDAYHWSVTDEIIQIMNKGDE